MPHNSGIGGGGFIMHHDGRTGVLESIDGREAAPAATRPDRFMGADGQPFPFRQAWPGGYRSAELTSELQSRMRNSYAVCSLKRQQMDCNNSENYYEL